MGLLSTIGAASGRAFGLTRVSAAIRDVYFNLTTLLLPGNGTNTAQNNQFIDSSTNNFTITQNGNTTQGTFSPFSQTGWGLRTNDRSFLSIPASSDFDLISTDFTVEFWFNLNAFNTMSFAGNNFFGNGLATATNGWALSFDGSGTTATSVTFGVWNGGSFSTNVFSGLTLNMGTWYHVVLQRNGTGAGNLRLFINGVLQGSAANSVTYSTAGSTFTFGSGAYTQNGTYSGNADYYISNVRLTKAAVYSTSGFTSPTSNLSHISGTTLLICQSNRLINNGTNTGAITTDGWVSTRAQVVPFSPFAPTSAYSAATVGGSGYFDGTGDSLSVADNAAFTLGSGNFTIELWAYSTLAGTRQFLAGQINSGGLNSSASFTIEKTAANKLASAIYSGSTAYTATSSADIRLNAWTHIAFVRDGNTLRQYINGVQDGTIGVTGVTANDSSTQLAIGRAGEFTTVLYFGYLSGYRFVSGTCLYPSGTSFTPPTAPLTAVTNTQLLLNFTNAGITDATAKNDLETVGNAQISTTQSKFGGSSMYFDGTGDYLIPNAATTDLYAFGTGDFTIEMWVYPVSSSTSSLYDSRPSGTNGAYLQIAIVSGQLLLGLNNTAILQAGTISTNTWTHLAVSRSGTSLRGFINGTQVGSTVTNSTSLLNVAQRPVIGTNGNTVTIENFNGYMDDLRVTKGYARYTANFTAPTSAFPLQ